ncbi:hypothetical protein [Flavobacterium cutihirudinis]|nr:hypothetical protein [Flavobacterium cutihirudinis]
MRSERIKLLDMAFCMVLGFRGLANIGANKIFANSLRLMKPSLR